MASVVPMLAYEDGNAAMDWLIRAFGFNERTRYTADDGTLTHGELAIGDDGVVMLATPTARYESPAHHREHCEQAAAWSEVPYIIDGVLVEVDDLDAQFGRVKAAGAHILSEPEPADGGAFRHFRVEDLEGHRWMFSGR